MHLRPALPLAASLLLLSSSLFASVRPHHRTSAHPIVRRSASTRVTRGSHGIEHASYAGIGTERATEIQTALIQHGYLSGEPSGSWDAASIAAMEKVQADNGWQTKFVPDSRALIKLGLGANPGGTGSPASTASAGNVGATVAATTTMP